MKWTGRAKMPEFDAGVIWLDSGMFWLSWVTEVNEASAMMCVPNRWADWAKQKTVLRHAGFILTISSMAVAPASRWGRWGSRRGRRGCWGRAGGGRRSSWCASVSGQLAPSLLACWLARLCLPGKSRLDWHRPAAQETYTQTYSIYPHTHTLTNSIFVHFCWKANLLKIYPLHPDTQTLQTFVHILFIGRNIYSIIHTLKLTFIVSLVQVYIIVEFEIWSNFFWQMSGRLLSCCPETRCVLYLRCRPESGHIFFLLQARHKTHLSLHKYRIWKLFLVHECCWSRTINAFIAPHWTIEHCLFGTLLSDKALESRYKPLLEEN